MLRVSVKREFDAAHKLEGHPGKCSSLHGHTWVVEAVFIGNSVDEFGFVIDFGRAGSILSDVISEYDHAYLNEIPPFGSTPPTAENMAVIIFERLTEKAGSLVPAVKVESVKVWESSNNWAMYSTD